MKYQILFSGKNKKNISKCRLLKILPGILSVNLSSANFGTRVPQLLVSLFLFLVFFFNQKSIAIFFLFLQEIYV